MTEPLRVLDLFAGAGGFSAGFERTGRFRTVAAVESDPAAAATFRANHPSVNMFTGDIADWLRDSRVEADVVIGGPPCQGFSSLGKRQPRDPRNALWRRYVEALARARPTYFVLENVADFLSSGQFRDLRRETHRGGRLYDYSLDYGVLNAAQYGAPQVRKRAVVIGSHRDVIRPGMPKPTHPNSRDWRTVRSVIGSLPLEVETINLPDLPGGPRGAAIPGPYQMADLHVGRSPTSLSLARYRAIPPGGNRRDLPDELLAPCWRGRYGGSGDVMGRLHWDKPAVTIRTEFWKPEKGRYLHPVADRAITHLEAALLQEFGVDFVWHGTKIEIGRQIGNAIPRSLAQAVAGQIARSSDRGAAPEPAMLVS